jgi:ribonucleotide monophosphatase NagD (HAD superfamily)
MAFGPFNYILKNHCLRNGFDLEHIYFGKPEKKAFKFVEEELRRRINQEELCFFMVGDNPRADICGANRAEWASFLTQTGVHHGDQNDITNPATVVVQDFK